eukprot:GILI01028563.1.p1 GENE.GILI01028563.1~~GILI01028563.1.p1  ORF type:complete len:251 (-),score=59.02 GILI01028563.1:99-851(-)
MSRFRHTSRGDVMNFMGESREKIIVAPTGIIRSDVSFDDQVKEYNERKAMLAQHRQMIEKLRTEREAEENLSGSRRPSRGGTNSVNAADLNALREREAATLAAKKALEEMKAYAAEIQRQRSPSPVPLQAADTSTAESSTNQPERPRPKPLGSEDDMLCKEPSQYNKTLNESNLQAIMSGTEPEPLSEEPQASSPMKPLVMPTQEELDAAPPQVSLVTARVPISQQTPAEKGREFLHAIIMAHLTVRGML